MSTSKNPHPDDGQALACGCVVHARVRLNPGSPLSRGEHGIQLRHDCRPHYIETTYDIQLIEVDVERIDYCRTHHGRRYSAGEVPAGPAETSRLAARDLSLLLSRRETQVLRVLAEAGSSGLEVEQVAERALLNLRQAAPRLTTLARRIPEPLVRDTGRRGRLTTGRLAIIWSITDAGREKLYEQENNPARAHACKAP